MKRFVQVTICLALLSGLAVLAAAADCPNGQCSRPPARVRVTTLAVRVDVRTRPATVRVRVSRPPIRAWLGLFPRME